MVKNGTGLASPSVRNADNRIIRALDAGYYPAWLSKQAFVQFSGS